jgi:prolyl 4-hydroxylase
MSDGSPAVQRAHELDAAGRHDDAINQLASASQAGDFEAMTQLAKRIIVGDRAPRLMPQGFSLLSDAVKLGSAEAAERMAVVYATGITGTPDWQAALRLLVLAAERGWTPAYRQLDVLASMASTEPASSGDCAQRSPASYLADIHLRALLARPEGFVLHADPLVRHFPAFLNRRVCKWLIDRARGKLTRALVYDVVSQKDVADDARTNSFAVFHNMEADLVHLDPEKPGYDEDIRRSGYRILTFLVYLNADYAGGETVFPKFGLNFRGQEGDGMYFVNTHANMHADLRTLHSGRPPTAGEKWVFSQFVRNRPGLATVS